MLANASKQLKQGRESATRPLLRRQKRKLAYPYARRREAAAKAKEIEDAVYDLKAVNPNRTPEVDERTVADLLAIIDAKGREINEALAPLRALSL